MPAGLGAQLRRLGRHSAIYGIGGLVSRVIAVLLLPLYTRYLHPTDYGQIETLLALTTVMGLILRAGITSAFFRFYFDETDDAGRRRVLRTSFWFTMGGATLGLALLLLFAEPVSSLLFGTSDAADLVRAAGVALWATVNYEQLTALFRVEERSVAYVCASLANIFLTIGLTLLLVVVLEEGPLGVIVGNFSGTLIVYLSLLGYRREQLGLEFDRGLLREMNRFGIPLVPTALFLWMTNFSDRFFLVWLADVAEAGIYSVGVRIASAMVLLLTAFRTAWPAFAYSIRDEREARQTYAYVLTYLTVITAWVALALSVLAPWLVDLLADEAFAEASEVVGPLAFSTVAYGAYIVVAIGVGRARRTQFNWVVTGIAARGQRRTQPRADPRVRDGRRGDRDGRRVRVDGDRDGLVVAAHLPRPVPVAARRDGGARGGGARRDRQASSTPGLLGAFALIAAYPFALLALGFTSPVERRRLRALVTQRGA